MLDVSLALRAGKEHKSLRRPSFDSQLELVKIDGKDCIRYTEDMSTKSNQGGLKHCNIRTKVVTIYPSENVQRCPVRIITKYINMLLTSMKCKDFYLQANSKKQIISSGLWYRDRPIGVNTLLAEECGLSGYFTNHSLRSTAATILHNAPENITEQVICEATGHRSTAVTGYKHTHKSIKERVSNILTNVTSGENIGHGVRSDEKVPKPMKNSVLKADRDD